MSATWYPSVGCNVQLVGLQCADLNGLRGTVVPKDPGLPEDRVGVRVDIGTVSKRIAVKLENVKPVDFMQLTLRTSNLMLMKWVGYFCTALPNPIKGRIWGFLRNPSQLEVITREGLCMISLQKGCVEWMKRSDELYLIPETLCSLVDNGSCGGRVFHLANQSLKVVPCATGFSLVRYGSVQCRPPCFEWVHGQRPIPSFQPMRNPHPLKLRSRLESSSYEESSVADGESLVSIEGMDLQEEARFPKSSFEVVLQCIGERIIFNPDQIVIARDGTWAGCFVNGIWMMDLSTRYLEQVYQPDEARKMKLCVHEKLLLCANSHVPHVLTTWQCADSRFHSLSYRFFGDIGCITSGKPLVAVLVFDSPQRDPRSSHIELMECRDQDDGSTHLQRVHTVCSIPDPDGCAQALYVGQGMLATLHKRSCSLDACSGSDSLSETDHISDDESDSSWNQGTRYWEVWSLKVWNCDMMPNSPIFSMDVTPNRPPFCTMIPEPMPQVGIWQGAIPKLSEVISLLEAKVEEIDMHSMAKAMEVKANPKSKEMDQTWHHEAAASVIEEIHGASSEFVATISPGEAAAIQEQQWASLVEHSIQHGSFVTCRNDMRCSGRCVLLEFNRGTKELEDAILETPPARRALQLGVDIQPVWANGAKVLVEEITSDDFEVPGMVLRPRHVVIHEAETRELLQALEDLSFRIRKLKSGCGKRVITQGSPASSCMSEFLSDNDIDESLGASSGLMSVFMSDDELPVADTHVAEEYLIEVHGTFIDFRNPSSKLTRHTI